jgi:hypothetical protein
VALTTLDFSRRHADFAVSTISSPLVPVYRPPEKPMWLEWIVDLRKIAGSLGDGHPTPRVAP